MELIQLCEYQEYLDTQFFFFRKIASRQGIMYGLALWPEDKASSKRK